MKPNILKSDPNKALKDATLYLLKEILRPMTDEDKEKCEGCQISACCGAFIDSDIQICHDCKDHATNACSECPEKDCPSRIDMDLK